LNPRSTNEDNMTNAAAQFIVSAPHDEKSNDPSQSQPRYWLAAEWSFVDEKGRKVTGGVSVRASSVSCLWKLDGEFEREGLCWEVATHAKRNGEGFGAIPRSTRFSTVEEALAAAPKKLAEQGKRYAKKYGSK
jgi:hypothetical protein